jgi:hypothetical protein
MIINHEEHTRNERNAGKVFSMCSLWLCFLVVISIPKICFAQKPESDRIANFKVRYSNTDYKFFPADNYLFVGTTNKLKITNTKGRKFEIKLTNGKIARTDSVFTIDGLVDFGSTLLSVYEFDAKGKKKLVLNKPFTVVSFPIVKFGGVRCDSAMPALMMAVGTLNVYYKNLNIKIPVSSFKMEFYENEKFTLDSSISNRLSKKMLTYVQKLNPGSLIYLSDIKYKDPNGAEHTEPIYRAFIIDEDKVMKFGW